MGEIIHGEPIDAYHARSEISHSKWRTFSQLGPRGYWLRHVRGEHRPEPSEAMAVGQAFEDAVCGRDTYVFPPEGHNGRTKDGKAWVKEQRDAGRLVVPSGYASFFEHGVAAVRDHATASALIEAAEDQSTMRAPWDGLPGIQSRPDWLCVGGCPESGWQPFSLDLKTTTSLRTMASSVRQYGYATQAAFVSMLGDECEVGDMLHGLLWVEKAFPFRAQLMWLSAGLVRSQIPRITDDLARMGEHHESGEWPRITTDAVFLTESWDVEGGADGQ